MNGTGQFSTQQGRGIHGWMIQNWHLLVPEKVLGIHRLSQNLSNTKEVDSFNLARDFTVLSLSKLIE